MSKVESAGFLVFRKNNNNYEFLLVRPGGPHFEEETNNSWSIPKGKIEENEKIFNAAIREFEEETGVKNIHYLATDNEVNFINLTSIKYKTGKTVHAWAVELDLDISKMTSNLCVTNINGQDITHKEIQDYKYFSLKEASNKLHKTQFNFILELMDKLKNKRLAIVYPKQEHQLDEIPEGEYCYKIIDKVKNENGGFKLTTKTCPHWGYSQTAGEQEFGYCKHLNEGDWESTGLSLLWDQVKMCSLNLGDSNEEQSY